MLKEFFRPTRGKVIITVVLFLINTAAAWSALNMILGCGGDVDSDSCFSLGENIFIWFAMICDWPVYATVFAGSILMFPFNRPDILDFFVLFGYAGIIISILWHYFIASIILVVADRYRKNKIKKSAI